MSLAVVWDRKTWPPSASVRTRAARATVGLNRSMPGMAFSPVCRPTRVRITIPSDQGSRPIRPTNSAAARTASPAPTNTETVESPSPIDWMRWPPWASTT